MDKHGAGWDIRCELHWKSMWAMKVWSKPAPGTWTGQNQDWCKGGKPGDGT